MEEEEMIVEALAAAAAPKEVSMKKRWKAPQVIMKKKKETVLKKKENIDFCLRLSQLLEAEDIPETQSYLPLAWFTETDCFTMNQTVATAEAGNYTKWIPCKIIETSKEGYTIVFDQEESQYRSCLEVFSVDTKPEACATRLVEALQLRSECEKHLKKQEIIKAMPRDLNGDPPLHNLPRLLPRAPPEGLVEEVVTDYQEAMNLLVYQALNRSAATLKKETIRLPQKIKSTDFQYCLKKEQWLASLTMKEHSPCEALEFFCLTDGRCTLDTFVRKQKSQSAKCLRFIKEQWISRAGQAVSRVLQGNPEIDQVDLKKYAESDICTFLRRLNFEMRHELSELVKAAFEDFVATLEESCSQHVQIPKSAICTHIAPESVLSFQIKIDANLRQVENISHSVLQIFDDTIDGIIQLPHIERYVMTRLYWPEPKNMLSSLDLSEYRKRLIAAIKKLDLPSEEYLSTYRRWQSLLHIKPEHFILEPVDLRFKLEKLKKWHTEVELYIPAIPITAGPLVFDTSELRTFLLHKIHDISHRLLTKHAAHLYLVASEINTEFKDLESSFRVRPENIEDVVTFENYINSHHLDFSKIEHLLADDAILDEFAFKREFDHFECIHKTALWPLKFLTLKREALSLISASREQFYQDLIADIALFEKTLPTLLRAFSESEEDLIDDSLRREDRLLEACEDAVLYNSRERLFGKDEVTDYSELFALRDQILNTPRGTGGTAAKALRNK